MRIIFVAILFFCQNIHANCFKKLSLVMHELAAQGVFVSQADTFFDHNLKRYRHGGICGPTCSVNLAEALRERLGVPRNYASLSDVNFNILSTMSRHGHQVMKGLTPKERSIPISLALQSLGISRGSSIVRIHGKKNIFKKHITRESINYLSGSMISVKSKQWRHFLIVTDFNPSTNILTLNESGFPKAQVQAKLVQKIVRSKRSRRPLYQYYEINFLGRNSPSGRQVYPKSAEVESVVIVNYKSVPADSH